MFLLCLQPISVVFHVTANGVGMLDPGAESNCVSVPVEFYLWMLLVLGYITIYTCLDMWSNLLMSYAVV